MRLRSPGVTTSPGSGCAPCLNREDKLFILMFREFKTAVSFHLSPSIYILDFGPEPELECAIT